MNGGDITGDCVLEFKLDVLSN
ncbi:hypothetical protein A2U01_0114796, partial [Trifolium medium]|nr:hypothetical protein [Trifolium medium]